MLLYAVMVLFGVLLLFTTLSLWSLMEGKQAIAGVLIGSSLLTAASSLKALQTFIQVLRVEQGVPKLALAPFFFLLISLLIASNLFANL